MLRRSLVHLSALRRDRVDFPSPVSVLRKYGVCMYISGNRVSRGGKIRACGQLSLWGLTDIGNPSERVCMWAWIPWDNKRQDTQLAFPMTRSIYFKTFTNTEEPAVFDGLREPLCICRDQALTILYPFVTWCGNWKILSIPLSVSSTMNDETLGKKHWLGTALC